MAVRRLGPVGTDEIPGGLVEVLPREVGTAFEVDAMTSRESRRRRSSEEWKESAVRVIGPRGGEIVI